jgi:tetratricopeptide (TPR) repeat protein
MRITAAAPVLLFLIVSTIGCESPGRRETPRPQLFDGLGNHRRTVTTSSPEAQQYFNQALTWTFSFNHDEAIRSYEHAGALDPDCAMAWWGVALACGPHVNFPLMTPERSKLAWAALQKARAASSKASPSERALIDALGKRYVADPPADRRSLDEAYAAAMRNVWNSHRRDADIGALYAESLMDLQPWDYWAKDGSAKGNSNEIVAVLEEVLKLDASHPGGLHLYIHAVEASSNPQRAIVAADRLRNLVPLSGHMVHMPSHIDIRVGEWVKAAAANERAIESDRKYRTLSPRQDFYRFYMAHNQHFLSFTAMMEGRSAEALRVAREMLASVPADYARQNAALVDALIPFASEVLMRFGRWDETLREPQPAEYFPIARAMWRFSRAIAYAAKDDLENAVKEQAAFRSDVGKVPEDAMISINKARKVLSIAEHMLAGEIAFRQNKIDTAVTELREGIQIEDDLLYMEPPEWLQPVRHTLGAILAQQRRWAEAEQVYRDDLRYWPENGWSLHGLAESLRAQGKSAEAATMDARFKKAWSRADIQIASSCLCVALAD